MMCMTKMKRHEKRKSSRFILLLSVISMLLCGCEFIYGLLQREGAEEKALLGELLPYTPNEKVQEVQELLKIYGFNPGKADGLMGQKTRDALEEFQKFSGLRTSRFVDKRTWRKLNVAKEEDLVKDGEINVMAVQLILNEAGFDAGKIDGKMGPKTNAALREFQVANGLKPDGVIGPMTFRRLIDHIPAR